jgi:hypothetical protein
MLGGLHDRSGSAAVLLSGTHGPTRRPQVLDRTASGRSSRACPLDFGARAGDRFASPSFGGVRTSEDCFRREPYFGLAHECWLSFRLRSFPRRTL